MPLQQQRPGHKPATWVFTQVGGFQPLPMSVPCQLHCLQKDCSINMPFVQSSSCVFNSRYSLYSKAFCTGSPLMPLPCPVTMLSDDCACAQQVYLWLNMFPWTEGYGTILSNMQGTSSKMRLLLLLLFPLHMKFQNSLEGVSWFSPCSEKSMAPVENGNLVPSTLET